MHVSFGGTTVSTGHVLTADVELCDEAALCDNRRVSNGIHRVKACQLGSQKTSE